MLNGLDADQKAVTSFTTNVRKEFSLPACVVFSVAGSLIMLLETIMDPDQTAH